MLFITRIKSNRLAVGIILTAGIISIAWLVWFWGATKYQSTINHWIEAGRSEGYEITYDRREQFGFPSHTVLRFINVHWKNTDGIEFHAGDLDIGADFWETKKFTAKFKGQVQIDAPVDSDHYTLILAGESGTAKIALADDGSWEECGINMGSARAGRAPDYLFLADNLKLSAKRPDVQPSSIKEAGLTLSGEANQVTLPATVPESFGPKMPKLQLDMKVMGAVPDFRKKDAVEAWNKKFGTVEFDHLNLEWGDLLLSSKGTMGFDDDLQPEGAFAATIGHQEKVLETLMKAGYIAQQQEGMLSSAMRLFAKPSAIDGESGVEVPVAVQLGGLFLGPVKIFAYPPIGWE